jgi:cell division protein FtsQ
MSRSRAATPAAKRRAARKRPPAKRSANGAPTAAKRPASKSARAKGATAKRAAAKRPATKRTAPKRTAPKRTAPKRSTTRRATAKRSPGARPHASRRVAGRSTIKRYRARRWFRRRSARPRGPRRWGYRLGVAAILALTAAAGYFLWLRDSSLVAVTDVEVAGVTSGDRERIVAELTGLAEQQTTLHADPARIEKAATAYPTIKSVSVDPNFPHGMRIEVTERPPALVAESGGERTAIAADGTVLAGVSVADDEQLPVLELDRAPAGALEGEPLQQALILGATPEPLRPLVHAVGIDPDYGVEVTLRGGIPVRFGNGAAATEKWAAAAAVLASPKLDALTYLDVRVPERPTAGGNG